MKKIFISLLALSLLTSKMYSQQINSGTTKAVQVELLGTYNMAGVSYEIRPASLKNKIGFKFGVGFGFTNDDRVHLSSLKPSAIFIGQQAYQIVSLPMQANYLLGKKNHKLELGVGISPYVTNVKLDDKSNLGCYWTTNVGYRYQNMRKKFVLSTGLTTIVTKPFNNIESVNRVSVLPYFSIGKIL